MTAEQTNDHKNDCPGLNNPNKKDQELSEECVVGAYEMMSRAEKAVQKSQEGGFPVEQVSIARRNP